MAGDDAEGEGQQALGDAGSANEEGAYNKESGAGLSRFCAVAGGEVEGDRGQEEANGAGSGNAGFDGFGGLKVANGDEEGDDLPAGFEDADKGRPKFVAEEGSCGCAGGRHYRLHSSMRLIGS